MIESAGHPQDAALPDVVIPDHDAETLQRAGRAWATTRQVIATELPGIDPDLERVEARGPQRDRYVRILRARSQGFERLAPGWLQATRRASAPVGRFAGARSKLRSAVIGKPMATRDFVHERLTKLKALAVLSSDPLSSVAYATEQTLVVLAGAGAMALNASLPIMAAIALLLIAVVVSYRQTIKALSLIHI